MNEKLEFVISKNARKVQQKFFVVPHVSDTLHLDIRVPDKCQYMGYVLLKDEKKHLRLQKLLGYGEQKLGIGKNGACTTIGGVPGVIQPGRWMVSIGIFTEYVERCLGEKEALVEIVITEDNRNITEPMGRQVWTGEAKTGISLDQFVWEREYQKECRWYKGDFHTHTRLSDGKDTVINAMKKAQLMDMDFYIPTEHNLMHTGWCDTKLCTVPGIEITTDQGHFNLFGITKEPERLMDIVRFNGKPQVEESVIGIMREANEKGWIVSLNHPFLTVWSWQYEKTRLDAFQCVEIINDPTYPDAPPSNDKAIHFLDTLWEDGHKIWGIGGSDAHNLSDEFYEGADHPSVIGDPGTYIFCEGLSPDNLLEHVKKGHICVTRFCKIEPMITYGGRTYLPGEELILDKFNNEKEQPLRYEAKITGLLNQPQVYLVKNNQQIPAKLQEGKPGTYVIKETVYLDITAWNFVRLELRGKAGELLGYVNPVYCGEGERACITVGDIWGRMRDIYND